jgi:hypothetical protein
MLGVRELRLADDRATLQVIQTRSLSIDCAHVDAAGTTVPRQRLQLQTLPFSRSARGLVEFHLLRHEAGRQIHTGRVVATRFGESARFGLRVNATVVGS